MVFEERVIFTTEAPQYDLPDLRGEQRTQRGYIFSLDGRRRPVKRIHLLKQKKLKPNNNILCVLCDSVVNI